MNTNISIFDCICSEIIIKDHIKEPTGCFWKIKKDEITVGYILGSIHVTPPYLLDLNHRIRKCFEKSSKLAVEVDVSSEDVIKEVDKRKQNQWNEQYKALTSEQIENIVVILKKIFPEDSEKVNFNKEEEKRSFIFKVIGELKFKISAELGLVQGIDWQLMKQAKTSSKPIESLESLEEYRRQETTKEENESGDPLRKALLEVLILEKLESVNDVADIVNQFVTQILLFLQPMLDAWEEGNLERLYDLLKDDSVEEEMVMTQRNLNMATKISKLIHEKERVFCCMGAAHTVGEMSVQNFLRNFGFLTERVFV